MVGFWVGLSIATTFKSVQSTLQSWFPSLIVGDFDLLMANPKRPWPAVVVSLTTTKSEFPELIDFHAFPGPQDEEVIQPVAIELARRLAEAYGCRAICEGSAHGDSPAPYWSIVWSDGDAYLADDCETAFADEAGGALRIVRRLELPSFALDDTGTLIPAAR